MLSCVLHLDFYTGCSMSISHYHVSNEKLHVIFS